MDLVHELQQLIARHAAGPSPSVTTVMDGVTIARADRPTPPTATIVQPSLAIVAQGTKRLVVNGVAREYGAGQYLVAPVDLPAVGQALRAPFAVVSLGLRADTLAPLLLEQTARVAPRPMSGPIISDASPELLDPVVRLLKTLDDPDDMRVLAPAYHREILWRLLTDEQGALVRQIGLANGNLTRVSRAIQWIRDHYREPILVGRLAEMSNMSPSSFHRYFRTATSMTPIQFQKQIRLQAARTMLMTQPSGVAEVGFLVGYESPSHFGRDYRKAFGTSPGREADRRVSEARSR
jgi:AraC-like DNA-binding protein